LDKGNDGANRWQTKKKGRKHRKQQHVEGGTEEMGGFKLDEAKIRAKGKV
jgi:hypothetical protein